MCTLIACWQTLPDTPLLLALNRDEFLERPTLPMHLWAHESEPPIVAGKDLRSGGSWFAIGPRIVAALTNHRGGGSSRSGKKSRGELVVEIARTSGMSDAIETVRNRNAADYGPFHLLFTDAKQMKCLSNGQGKMEIQSVDPGIHILGNYGLNNPDDPIVKNLGRELRDSASEPTSQIVERLKVLLEGHGAGWPCVHRSDYGTRSSAILNWKSKQPQLLETIGPPCTNPWHDRTELIEKLREAGEPFSPPHP